MPSDHPMSREAGLWMPMYWGDYLSDTLHLSTFQHGCYILLIAAYWQRGRPLPADKNYLANVCKTSKDKLARYGNPVLAMFEKKVLPNYLDGKPCLVHKRIELEILRSSARSAAGLKANSVRWSESPPSTATAIDTYTDRKKDADERTPVFRVLDAMKVRNDPNWHGDGGRVAGWIADGADLDLDILPTIERIMAKRNGQGPPRSLKYFDQAIADAKASRLNPLPPGTPRGNGNGHATGPITSLHRAGEKALAVRAERRRREAEARGDSAKPLLASK